MAFEPLSPEELATFEASNQGSGFTPLSTGLSGRIEFGSVQPTAEEFAALGEFRQRTKEASEPTETGVFPMESQPVAAVARGLLGGFTAELGEAALERGIQRDEFDPNSPQFTNPWTYGISEFIGGIGLPVGTIAKGVLGAKTLLTGATEAGRQVVRGAPSLAKEGLQLGGVLGAAGAEAEALRKDLGLQESLEKITKGTATGAALGLVAGGLITKAQALRMEPSETFLAFVKPRPGSKAENRSFEFIEGGKLEQAVGSVKNFFKVPENLTVKQAKDLSYKTADNLISKVDEVVDQFPQSKLLGSQLQEGLQRDVLNSPLLNSLDPTAQKELSEFAQKIGVDRTLKEGVALQKEINKKLRTYIEAIKMGGDPKLNDQLTFLDTLRRYNSNLIDDAFTGLTGTTDNPYRRWGSVSELGNVLHSRYKNLFNLRAQEKAGGLLGSIGRGKGWSSIVTGPYKYVVGGEMKNADTLVSSLFKNIPEYKISDLPASVAQQRLGRSVSTPFLNYNPSVPPPPLPTISPQNALNQAIAQSLGQTPMSRLPSGVTMAPNFPPATVAVPPVIGGVPSQAQLAEVIKRLVEDEAARRAQALEGGTLSFF